MNDINDVRKRLRADIARKDSPIEYSAHDRDVLALLDATEWRDIESAPNAADGGPPILVIGGVRKRASIEVADGLWWRGERDRGSRMAPTHWMPLPEPPHD